MPTYLDFKPIPWTTAIERLHSYINEHKFWLVDLLDDDLYGVPALWLAGREPLKEPVRIIKLVTGKFDIPEDASAQERAEILALQRATALTMFALPYLFERFLELGVVPAKAPDVGKDFPWKDIPAYRFPQEGTWALPLVAPSILRMCGEISLVFDRATRADVDVRWKAGDRSLLPTDMISFNRALDQENQARHMFSLEWNHSAPDRMLKAALLILAQLPRVMHWIYANGDLPTLTDPTLLDVYGLPRDEKLGDVMNFGWEPGHEVTKGGEEERDEYVPSQSEVVKGFRDLDDKEVHDITVASWLDFSTEITKKAADASIGIYDDLVGEDRLMVDLVPVLRDARVLQFRPEVVHRVLGEVNAYVTKLARREHQRRQEEAGLPVEADPPNVDLGSLLALDHMAEGIPFPTPLPFPSMFLGWGPGVPIPANLAMVLTDMMYPPRDRKSLAPTGGAAIAHPWKRDDKTGRVVAYLHGILLTQAGPDGEEGNAYVVMENHNHKANLMMSLRRNGRWTLPPFMQGPWLLSWFVAAINANDLVIDDKHSLRRRMKFQKFAKAIGKRPLPRPWYMVTLHPGVLKIRRTIVSKMPREWRYRFDVIGHDVRRVKRGDIPLAEADIRDLIKRKYRIFTRLNPPDADALEVLMRADEPPPADDEWVAVQKVWRRPYVKGPANAPYVPSVHALRKKQQA